MIAKKLMVPTLLLFVLASCTAGEVTGPSGLVPETIPTGTGTTYYVAPSGSDANDGLSPATPFKTLQHGGDLLRAGDVLQLASGDYSQPDTSRPVLSLKHSGTSGAWISVRAASGQHPRIVSRNRHGIQIDSSSYILIESLELKGNNAQIDSATAVAHATDVTNPLTTANGILIGGLARYSHDIAIRYNDIHDFPGSGIGSVNSDYIRIQGNTIHDNALYSPKAGSGVSTFQNWNSDLGSAYHNRIINNLIYHNRNLVPSIYTGTFTDGNGIIIDDSRNTKGTATIGAYAGRTLIENNVVYENGGRGIHVYLSDHVDIVNNSTYHNTLQPRGTKGEITVVSSGDVKTRNNILVSPAGGRALQLYLATGVTNDYNIVGDATHYDQPGAHDRLNANPQYVGVPANLTLKSNSPAIDGGTLSLYAHDDILGKGRPFGRTVDVGAYEYGAP